jgi:tRNA pseudouridine38-40 synthase
MFRYFVRLAFVGTNYHGWQAQDNAITVQQQITEAIGVIESHDIQFTGCGRTDAGVHARDFYAHFDYPKWLTTEQRLKLKYRMNSYLPDDIGIIDILSVAPDSHARFSAVSRTYKYIVNRTKDPFCNGFSYFVSGPLDVELMNRGAELLLKCSDFSSFAKNHTQVKTNICDLHCARWEGDEKYLTFTVTANRFLRNMVRAMVGTLLDLGKGAIDIKMLQEIIEKKSRSSAGYSVPACGLFLIDVKYPSVIFLQSETGDQVNPI